ncbi:MAG: ATP synthase F1 subunit epsilon [Candidatus Magasanikbacteria bacterium CG10_big_fil_rev_8_21_14_0_10_40_10]|uniref:ATP synthase epsilon chain n=1 Tax=Candidatus Magasanikbacteria bacterium CG10_big_fil_rev_8_21_14_0_10_40_10 TaxID=1974648 RepID=A0A2M6W4Y9_9BACT|nr:MAG: ATP synthase F1 subunit epsilon [Candidatus Magasanikbacteria bacterium CG10_big_fil_rev_8_21_14_0_10_40_10]
MNLKIVTPEKTIYENEVFQASIPTSEGEITVLPNHIPLVSILQAGEMKIKDKNGDHIMAISGGFLEVKANNEIIILADNAERADEIDLDRAQEARQRAEEQMIKAQGQEDIDFARLQAVIDRETNRLRVGKKYKKLPPTNN